MSSTKTYLFLLPALLACTTSFPQTQKVETSEAELKHYYSKVDSFLFYLTTGKAILNTQGCVLPSHHHYFIPSLGFLLPKYVRDLSTREKKQYARMSALMQKGTDNYEKKDFLASDFCWQQALGIAVKEDFDYEELHGIRPALNNNCFLSGNFSGAMRISSEGLIRAEKIGDMNRVAHFNNVIGCIHMKLGNFEEAERYFHIYESQARSVHDTIMIAHALYNLADLALARGWFDLSINYAKASFAAYRSVPDHPNKGFSLMEREAFVINKMAEAAKLKGDLVLALSYALRASSIGTTAHGVNEYDKASYQINTGDVYARLEKNDSAMYHLQKGLAIARHISHREYIRDAYQKISQVFAGKKMFDSAFAYQQKFVQLQDSIAGESTRLEIFQQETALQIEQQQHRQQAALDRQRLLTSIMGGVAVLLLIIFYLLYNRYLLRQKTRHQKELNLQQNELFNAIAAAQDQERKRIAQDIHDSLGAILSAAKLRLSALMENGLYSNMDNDEHYRDTVQLLDEASSELRHISHNIMPASLSKLGLVAALKNLVSNISAHSGIHVQFSAHDFDQRLDEDVEMSIYRIVLELINNSVKHSQAAQLTIQLVRHPDYINLSVDDNGKGFDYKAAVDAKKGIGLGNILSRVKYLGGTLNVDSAPGRGTVVLIDIPYPLKIQKYQDTGRENRAVV